MAVVVTWIGVAALFVFMWIADHSGKGVRLFCAFSWTMCAVVGLWLLVPYADAMGDAWGLIIMGALAIVACLSVIWLIAVWRAPPAAASSSSGSFVPKSAPVRPTWGRPRFGRRRVSSRYAGYRRVPRGGRP